MPAHRIHIAMHAALLPPEVLRLFSGLDGPDSRAHL